MLLKKQTIGARKNLLLHPGQLAGTHPSVAWVGPSVILSLHDPLLLRWLFLQETAPLKEPLGNEAEGFGLVSYGLGEAKSS